MTDERKTLGVLVVSSGTKASDFFKSILPEKQYSPLLLAPSCSEAKRMLIETGFDIVIINTPLCDEFGVQFAIETANSTDSGVMIFVKSELYEQVAFKTEEFGIFTLSRPTNKQTVFEALRMLTASRSRYMALREKSNTLEQKMLDIRLVNRAKALLLQNEKMTEQQAHRYIEKAAMDLCVKKTVIAQNIIEKYGD